MLITEMRQGIPCWFELSSTDAEQSFAFYNGLFGWQRTDMDMGEMGTYSFLSNSNGTIGAFCNMMPDQKAQGVPSYWGVYFAVDDCDATTARVSELGGNVFMPPFDVSEHGRMSVLADPAGAVFCLWQSKSSGSGNFVMFEDHSIGWVELATRDTEQAREFYAKLLDWNYADSKISVPELGNYTEIQVGETRFGGILPMSPEWGDAPSHWGIYIMVPDVDACCERAKELGGENCLAPFDAPGVGRLAMITDPTGANCYVIKLSQ
jgi:predicted enzyme related to lactoylglutathione lyase